MRGEVDLKKCLGFFVGGIEFYVKNYPELQIFGIENFFWFGFGDFMVFKGLFLRV